MVGTSLEEVIVQDDANLEQRFGMYPRVAEELVKVLAAAMDLGG